ncbi:hypothetical protein APHACPA_0176 [Rickettsia amblyommatis str. Ac/Pa]|uniref:Uncharacterized protein n=1 Tax=Rickettsia amblyommatis str. Ac/Pa TaxID=1359164 RepID=A0A0F3MZL0_RICAM|nr:hypothetical protein APHACPA_0176 [Rickettsia amblyommatis str. Ac/Pa]
MKRLALFHIKLRLSALHFICSIFFNKRKNHDKKYWKNYSDYFSGGGCKIYE